MSKHAARTPDATFQIPSGIVQLARTKNRSLQIRRKGSFGWTLGSDNLLTREIEAHLRTDLAGSVAAQLLARASLTWEIAPHVRLLHEPNDVGQLQPTPDLEDAAEQMADAFRAEIDAAAILNEVHERLEGPFLWRSAYAVHIGRRTKASPDQPERCFGRLAPLGVSSLQTVVPWLGYVPAQALTEWPHYHFIGSAGRKSTELSVQYPHVDLWLQPEYKAANRATEILAVTDGLRAAVRAPQMAPLITLACDDLIVCRPLRTLFAPRLRLTLPDGSERPVIRPLPLKDHPTLKILVDELGHGAVAKELSKGWWNIAPFSPSRFLRHLPENEALLHALLWVALEESDFALDPWTYTDLDERGLPGWNESVCFYDLDTRGFSTAVSEVMAGALPGRLAKGEAARLAASCQRTIALLRNDLEPMLRAYEGGEVAALLEAVQELRKQLEGVTREVLTNQKEAAEQPPARG